MERLGRQALGYLRVPQGSGQGPQHLRGHRSFSKFQVLTVSAVSSAFGLLVGLFVCWSSSSCSAVAQDHLLSPSPAITDLTLKAIETAFSYNKTFASDPYENDEVDEAWDSMMPAGLGFVRLPQDKSLHYGLSVVHQLHCLWAIQHGYYQAQAKAGDATTGHQRPRHERHCFDYLRQTLACAADMTLEPVQQTLGGVTGWGNKRVCRDYKQVVAWAESHRYSDLQSFRSMPH